MWWTIAQTGLILLAVSIIALAIEDERRRVHRCIIDGCDRLHAPGSLLCWEHEDELERRVWQ